MLIAIAVILLTAGTVIFHFASPWWFTPIASNWVDIDTTIMITFWVTGVVFVIINLFLAYAVIRYRHRKGQRATYDPENKKLEWWLTGITAVGVIAMLAPGLFVWADFVEVPEDAKSFEAVGQQWHWSYRFPGEDGIFGLVDGRNISVDNPFGMDPEDPNGQDDVLITSNEVHLPLNQPYRALLRSTDVLHDFAVPQFRVKMDLVPGMITYVWFEPTRTGSFEILCEELCGMAHHTMRGRVIVEEEEDFRNWLASQPTYAQMQNMSAGNADIGKAQYAACAACHGFEGEGNQLLNAPKLAGQESWYMRSQLKNYKEGARGSNADDILGQQMAPLAATLVDEAAVSNVIAYIGTLPDKPAPATVLGDIERGESLYANCAACHGENGQGIWTAGAPRQAGMSDWYLVKQLQNFKQGIRGSHPQDKFGPQMISMADILKDDEAINDVVAYINTL